MFPIDKSELKVRNIQAYKGMAPDWERISKIITDSGLKSAARFEKVWGIPNGTLDQVKFGSRELPVAYWHIFYEFKRMRREANKKLSTRKKKVASPQVPEQNNPVLQSNKALIDEYRQKQFAVR